MGLLLAFEAKQFLLVWDCFLYFRILKSPTSRHWDNRNSHMCFLSPSGGLGWYCRIPGPSLGMERLWTSKTSDKVELKLMAVKRRGPGNLSHCTSWSQAPNSLTTILLPKLLPFTGTCYTHTKTNHKTVYLVINTQSNNIVPRSPCWTPASGMINCLPTPKFPEHLPLSALCTRSHAVITHLFTYFSTASRNTAQATYLIFQ